MKTPVLLSTVAALGLALAACGQKDNDANAVNDQVTTNDVGSLDNNAAAANAALPAAPQTAAEFAAAAAASDLFEIESSKLAQSQASGAKVKDFAAMLVKDHTNSTNELKSVAAKENITLVPPALDADKQAKLDALKAASGEDFDRLYISQQIPAHEQALQLMQGYAAGGDNAAVKAFASKTAPVIQKHLDEAKSLSK
jgi:putative membrane protein